MQRWRTVEGGAKRRGPPKQARDEEEEMVMARLYTTEEAYRKLGVSQATFYRWVTKAREQGFGDKVEAQPSSDGRESLYLLSQLRWLAKEHGKELLPDEEITEKHSDVDVLWRDLRRMEQLLKEEQTTSQHLRERMQQLEQETDAKVREVYSFCMQQIGQIHTDLARMHAQTSSAASLQWSPSAVPHAPVPPPTEIPVGGMLPVGIATSPIPGDLPAGTVSLASFAEAHHVARDLVMVAVRRGDVEAIAREHRNGLRRMRYFLTPQQQDRAVIYLERQHLPIRRCSLCPHSSFSR